MGNDLNRYFSKDDIQMAKKYMKRCSTSLDIKEMQIRTVVRHYFILTGMAIIKSSGSNNRWLGYI